MSLDSENANEKREDKKAQYSKPDKKQDWENYW